MRGDAVGSRTLGVLAVLLSIALGSTRAALADEGVLEINHTCAVASGCVPGDAAGYPVLIRTTGSYRLTSNLSGTIEVGVERVSIDLNGFLIAPGVFFSGVSGGRRVSVHDGRIAGPCFVGVEVGDYARVERVEVSGCFVGVSVGNYSHVRGVNASENGGDGIRAGGASVIGDSIANGNAGSGFVLSSGTVEACTATSNGQYGGNFSSSIAFVDTSLVTFSGSYFTLNSVADVVHGHAGTGNYCHDKSCSTDGRKRFFLTAGSHTAPAAVLACGGGFHFASLFELHDPSGLQYATSGALESLAKVNPDGGVGPPSHLVGGWLRTGSAPSIANQPGQANCNHWQDTTQGNFGTGATLSSDWLSASRTDTPWVTASYWCSDLRPVWCIED